jgi:hypothetical protein
MSKLLEDLKAASGDLALARRQLADERFKMRHGMAAGGLLFAESREHVAYHRWLRAHEAFAACAPKPRPASAPKPVPVANGPKPAPAPETSAPALDLLGHLEDRCRDSENRWRARSGLPRIPRS